jgi:hypothetical protein
MANKVQDIDRGWNKFVENISKHSESGIKVGVLQTAPNTADGQTQATIAAQNEFGTKSIPERSFLRSTIDENRVNYNVIIDSILERVYLENRSMREQLGLLGQKVQSDIKRKIVTLRTPPNAPATIAEKGSDNPLIDTGQMLNSISYEVELK